MKLSKFLSKKSCLHFYIEACFNFFFNSCYFFSTSLSFFSKFSNFLGLRCPSFLLCLCQSFLSLYLIKLANLSSQCSFACSKFIDSFNLSLKFSSEFRCAFCIFSSFFCQLYKLINFSFR